MEERKEGIGILPGINGGNRLRILLVKKETAENSMQRTQSSVDRRLLLHGLNCQAGNNNVACFALYSDGSENIADNKEEREKERVERTKEASDSSITPSITFG